MESEPTDPLDAGLQIADVFERAGVPYAIGGALAHSLWAVPRATVDVDIDVFVEDPELPRVFDALESIGIAVDRPQCLLDSANRGMFVVRLGSYRVDVFTPSIPFAWEAARTRRKEIISDRAAWFLSPEALAVFKLMFFRAKDIVDLQRMIAVQGTRLDAAYVRHHVVEMMGDDDERVRRWDELVRAHRPATPTA